MDPDRKKRKDSKLDSMKPESRVMELRDKLLANEGHEEILQWLLLECGVSSSAYSLTQFYKFHCAPLVRERRQLSAVKAEVLVDDAGRTDWTTATLELVKQTSFEIMNGQSIDHKTAEKFIKLVLKADAQAQTKDKAKELAKSKVDAGLEAMFAEIKGNKAAEAAFKQLQEAIKKS